MFEGIKRTKKTGMLPLLGEIFLAAPTLLLGAGLTYWYPRGNPESSYVEACGIALVVCALCFMGNRVTDWKTLKVCYLTVWAFAAIFAVISFVIISHNGGMAWS